MLLNVNKPSFLHSRPLRPVVDHGENPAQYLPTLEEELSPLRHSAIVLNGAVVALEPRRGLKAFGIATGLRTPESLLKKKLPVLETTRQVAQVDIVNRVLWEGPRLLAVVNLAASCQSCEHGNILAVNDTNNLTLGGTQVGWIGDRSVPITSQLG